MATYQGVNGKTYDTSTLKPVAAPLQPWQQKLIDVKTDPTAGAAALKDAGDKYNAYKALGTPEGLKKAADAHTWANQLRASMGTADQYNPVNGALLKPVTTDTVTTDTGGTVQTDTNQAPQNNNADLINSIYQNNLASQQQAAEKQRQTLQQGLNGQETNVNQNALQNLNNNDSLAAQQLKQLQEIQANNGVRGGDSITAAIGNQTAQQQGANSINQDKANQLRNIMEQRSLIDNNVSADNLALLQKLQATRDGQLIDQGNADRTFNYNAGQDTITNNRNAATDIYNQGQDTITNNRNAATDTLDTAKYELDVKKQHIDLANKLTELFGVKVNPTSNPMESYAQVAGLSTTAAQKIAADAKQSTFDNAIKLALANNTITQTQASMMNQARMADISQQNANTSSRNASTSAGNVAADNLRADNAVTLTAKGKEAQGTIAGDMADAKNEADVNDYFNNNASHFVPIVGQAAWQKMKKDALAPFAASAKTTASETAAAKKSSDSIRTKAVAAAQKDIRWANKNTNRDKLIKEYEKYYK